MKKVFLLLLITVLSHAYKHDIFVGTTGTYKPFSFSINSKLVGFEIDLANEIAKDIKHNPRLITTFRERLEDLLDKKKIDFIIAQVSIRQEKSRKYVFSEPYAYSPVYLIINKSTPQIKSISRFKGKKMGIVKNSYYAEITKRLIRPLQRGPIQNTVKLIEFKHVKYMLKAISSGEIVGGFTDYLSFEYYNKDNSLQIKTSSFPVVISEKAIMLRKTSKSDLLLKHINETIKRLKENGELKKLSMKWVGRDITKKVTLQQSIDAAKF